MVWAKEVKQTSDVEGTLMDALKILWQLVLWSELCLPCKRYTNDLIPSICNYDIWKLGLWRYNQGKIMSLDLALLD